MISNLSAGRVLIWLTYGIAVLATSVFLMHSWGLLWAGSVLLFWGSFYFLAGNGKLATASLLWLIMISWIWGGIFFGPPLVSMSDYDKTGRHHVANEMRQLGLAILNYESGHQHLPPAYKTDASGRPAHSWRVLILPLLNSEQSEQIYQQYRLDQPWDSPHNLSVASQLNEPLFGDESDPTLATYKLVSGPGTPFGADTKTKLEHGVDHSNWLAIVEDVSSPVLWTKPDDLTPAQVVKIFDAKNNPDGMFKKSGDRWSSTYTRKSWVSFLDGSIEKVYPLADSSQLLPFCLQDERPTGSISDLAIGDVKTVERHGADDGLIGCLAGLLLFGLTLAPAFGSRLSEFGEVFGLAFSFAIITVPIALVLIALFR